MSMVNIRTIDTESKMSNNNTDSFIKLQIMHDMISGKITRQDNKIEL